MRNWLIKIFYFLAGVIIGIFLFGKFKGYFNKPPEIGQTSKTIEKIIYKDSISVLFDTVYEPLKPPEIDTIAVLNDYYSKHSKIQNYSDSLVNITVKSNFEAGELWLDYIDYKITYPVSYLKPKLNSFSAGMITGLVNGKILLAPSLIYQREKISYYLGYNFQRENKGLFIGVNYKFMSW